jgi:hypothetical protein
MKITKRQLRRVIREAFSSPSIEKAQAAAIASNKKWAGSGSPDRKPDYGGWEPNPEVVELGNQLTAAMESGDEAEEARLMQALRDHSPEGADEVEDRAEAFHFSGPMRHTGGGIHEALTGRGGGIGNVVDRMEGMIDDAMLAQTQDEFWYDDPDNLATVNAWLDDLKSRFTESGIPAGAEREFITLREPGLE